MSVSETQCDVNSVVVVCGADNNYAMPLAVTLRSVTRNFKSQRKLELFVLDGGINELNKRKIINSLSSKNVSIHFLNPQQTKLDKIKPVRHLSLAACYRLLIPNLLPDDFSKAIYLDSDVIVEQNLEELWAIDMGENYALAVQDISMPYIADGLTNYCELGISPESKYFNSGVMVINLEKWRSEEIGQKVIEYLETAKSTKYLDQDGLNAILVEKWKELDFRWNQLRNIYYFSNWADSTFKREIESHYSNILNHPYIIHFTGPHKPWKPRCPHPKANRFVHYLGMTSWWYLLPYLYAQSCIGFCRYTWWNLKKSIQNELPHPKPRQ